MKTDLVLSPFGADPQQMLAAARAADAAGWDGVWTYDHFSARVASGPERRTWSRDPLVVLGALAARTSRVRLGILVANIANRHPAQLASALNTLQGLAPGRVVCGLGAGAGPGTQFATEAEAIGRPTPTIDVRRRLLVEHIAALRAIWRDEDHTGESLSTNGLSGVVDGAPMPPIVVGAGSNRTIRLAAHHADGVNLVAGGGPRLAEQAAIARAVATRGLEVSALLAFDADHPDGGDLAPLLAAGVDRRTLWIAPPYPVEEIRRVGERLVG